MCSAYDFNMEEHAGVLYQTVITGDKLYEGPNIYKMDSRKRGKCLIIYNENYKLPNSPLRGLKHDADRLKYVFTMFGFELNIVHDQEVLEIKDEIRRYALDPAHVDCDAGVIIFLGHGDKGCILGVDNLPMDINDLVEKLNNENCPGLRNKPKMVFIAACQGALFDQGVLASDAAPPRPRIPTTSDVLLAFAAQANYVTFISRNYGFHYVYSLVRIFSQHASEMNLLEMLQMVETDMRGHEVNYNGQQYILSTEFKGIGWNKWLYFNPGLHH